MNFPARNKHEVRKKSRKDKKMKTLILYATKHGAAKTL
jgi:hypothetical protein